MILGLVSLQANPSGCALAFFVFRKIPEQSSPGLLRDPRVGVVTG
jgi:hypothetical protein